MNKINVAIIGGSGYSGEELLRLLLRHPGVELTAITSRENAGKRVGDFFPRYSECDLRFVPPQVEEIAQAAEVVFLALPNGLASQYAAPLLEKGCKVIDLSADFRLRDPAVYEKYYKMAHPAPWLLPQAVYGLPELYREELRAARLVANPGCYVTSILLPVTALLRAKVASPRGIVAMSMSGVTGAGRKVSLDYIFPECNESLRPYGVTGHRHLPEIEQELAVAAQTPSVTMNFLPHLVPVNRGIHSSVLLDPMEGKSLEDAREALAHAYGGEPFVRVLEPGKLADTKHVTRTNLCEIGCLYDSHTGKLVVSSAIDNLTKGASGQAVQNMNLICGFPETTGLLVS
ncbi:MAG: N-acetyl-gamma-glutamyl-phosphate reductase [Oligosphaeraceae bacterium]